MSIPVGLIEDLHGLADRYGAMAALTEELLAHVASRPLHEAMALLDRKQRLLAETAAIDARLARLRADWDRVRGELEPSERPLVESALAETRAALASLLELENRMKEIVPPARLMAPPGPAAARLRAAYGGGPA